MVCFDIFHLRVTKTSRADWLREVEGSILSWSRFGLQIIIFLNCIFLIYRNKLILKITTFFLISGE